MTRLTIGDRDAAVLAVVAAPRRLPAAAPYFLVSSVVGLALFASVTPSPLYETYARLWHFSAVPTSYASSPPGWSP